MENLIAGYEPAVFCVGLMALLTLVQLLVADFVGIAKGHRPGATVEHDHSDFLFRATRAIGNTNESIAIFMLAFAFALMSGANQFWVNAFCGVYVAGRLGHMLAYYADLRLMRSIFFGIALMALVAMLITGFLSWV